ncbi:uncharacterized protein BYT42DRAFT_248010 [Radiomyces spectabilis]|uniref:uncharacterized protein n=1 Tax=Radiomyces spectabilis TaxID=64574 RepID=UPI0022200E5C|nr:uncharacterized protein BYT42DRAFT_248010 [Radiomyces spectabilis]KAI8388822.1 hypothetical protein BYT42DRAFT_248010 [Radiomyces spectabilis]
MSQPIDIVQKQGSNESPFDSPSYSPASHERHHHAGGFSTCSYCRHLAYDDPHVSGKASMSPLELQTISLSPPLDEVCSTWKAASAAADIDDSDQPYPYQSLIGLFTAPDMGAYLADVDIQDDVSTLPIQLQTMISEAKEEVIIERTKAQHRQQQQQQQQPQSQFHEDGDHQAFASESHPALRRLENLRDYLWIASGHDKANIAPTLGKLLQSEDELAALTQQQN